MINESNYLAKNAKREREQEREQHRRSHQEACVSHLLRGGNQAPGERQKEAPGGEPETERCSGGCECQQIAQLEKTGILDPLRHQEEAESRRIGYGVRECGAISKKTKTKRRDRRGGGPGTKGTK